MAVANVNDFSVDLETRRVKHKSGVEFSYYRRRTDEDWVESGPSFVRNPSLYDGDYRQLFFMAKIAALLGGMQRA